MDCEKIRECDHRHVQGCVNQTRIRVFNISRYYHVITCRVVIGVLGRTDVPETLFQPLALPNHMASSLGLKLQLIILIIQTGDFPTTAVQEPSKKVS